MSNILITGANGLLAYSLCDVLLKKKHTIYATTRDFSKSKVKGVNYIKLDFANNCVFSDLPKKIDIVIHAAQSLKYHQFPEESNDIFQVNINSTYKLLEYARNIKVKKFIYISSGGVYKRKEESIKETDDLLLPSELGMYLGSKICGETLSQSYSKFFDLVIVRPFFIYGPRQKNTMLIKRLMNNIINSEIIKINGKNGISINPIHVEDASLAITKIISKLNGNHIVNLAGEETFSIKKICDEIGTFLGRKPIYEFINDEVNDLIGDISFMKENLYSPKIKLIDALEELKDSIKFEKTP